MRRAVVILYILVFYVFFQFCWWAYLLIELNEEVYQNKIENVGLQTLSPNAREEQVKNLEEKILHRRWMVLGEGAVFFAILVWGSLVTMRSFRKEIALARQQKNFLLSITHEFKSPLASIKLYMQTLLRHDLQKEKAQSFIRSAINDTDRLNNLVENALFANLIDHKGYMMSKEELNVSELLKALLNKSENIPEHHPYSAEIEEGLIVYADKNALSIAFNNLIENAAKYSPPEKMVSLTAGKKDRKVVVTVSDEGQGIPGKEKQKVFEKFYRIGNEETRKTKGTGLGLFIVRYIVEDHGGRVFLEDNHPTGTIAVVELPLSSGKLS